MNYNPVFMSGTLNMLVVDVGNSRTQVGLVLGGNVEETASLGNDDAAGIVDRILTWWKTLTTDDTRAILMASVNDSLADRLASMLNDQLSEEVYRVGDDLPVPIAEDLDPETITGVDRLLNAAAAFDTVKQACVVVDAGTAVTIDFIDGGGTFHGGAIAPGTRMQLRALHDFTEALPEVEFATPAQGEYGKSTSEAMLQGVYHGIRGLVRRLVEQYAEAYGAFPMVVVTGGDAEMLFGEDELVDRIVPHLTLLGIVATARHVLASEPGHQE